MKQDAAFVALLIWVLYLTLKALIWWYFALWVINCSIVSLLDWQWPCLMALLYCWWFSSESCGHRTKLQNLDVLIVKMAVFSFCRTNSALNFGWFFLVYLVSFYLSPAHDHDWSSLHLVTHFSLMYLHISDSHWFLYICCYCSSSCFWREVIDVSFRNPLCFSGWRNLTGKCSWLNLTLKGILIQNLSGFWLNDLGSSFFFPSLVSFSLLVISSFLFSSCNL